MKSLNSSRAISRALLLVTAVFTSVSVQAVNLSAFRIYLDKEQRTTSFIIHNRDVAPQECKLRLRHYNFTNDGEMNLHKGKQLPANSAATWVRFSPRFFTLSPANAQTVRFSMRRKANASAAEYRSYLSIDCGLEIKNDPSHKRSLVNIRPRLVHNIPIIVRTKPMDVKIKFRDFQLVGSELRFNLERIGDRSIYGNLELRDQSGNKIGGTNGIAVYPETLLKPFKYNLGKADPKGIRIVFEGDKAFGSPEKIEQIVNLKP